MREWKQIGELEHRDGSVTQKTAQKGQRLFKSRAIKRKEK